MQQLINSFIDQLQHRRREHLSGRVGQFYRDEYHLDPHQIFHTFRVWGHISAEDIIREYINELYGCRAVQILSGDTGIVLMNGFRAEVVLMHYLIRHSMEFERASSAQDLGGMLLDRRRQH